MKRYDTEVNGVPTTLLLSDEDAKARGLTKEAKAPANKAAKAPANKEAEPPTKATAAEKRTAAAKSSFGQAKK